MVFSIGAAFPRLLDDYIKKLPANIIKANQYMITHEEEFTKKYR